jgi:two-component system, cell cycle sensor histidine kinase and response regulator CckA
MLRRLIGGDVELTTSMDPDVAPILIDPSQLEQVLLNLVVNARDAMPNGGTVRVVLANTRIDAAWSGQAVLAPGDYVELSVADTGSGMTDEVKSHVFEPFFTTKQEERGTGLGLATVYGVVEKAGGTIEIDSEVGRGTTFRILLPAASEAESSRVGERTAPPRGTATVLLVEQEPVSV